LHALADLIALEHGLDTAYDGPQAQDPQARPGAVQGQTDRQSAFSSGPRRTALPCANRPSQQHQGQHQRQDLLQTQQQGQQQRQRQEGTSDQPGPAAAQAGMEEVAAMEEVAFEHLADLLPPVEASEARRARSQRQLQESWKEKRPTAFTAYVARHAVPVGGSCACCGSAEAVVRCLDCQVGCPSSPSCICPSSNL